MSLALGSWIPRLRRAAIALAVLVVLFGVVGYFAIPKAVRWGLETVASRELGRTVKVESVSANPFTLRATMRGVVIDGAPGETAPLLSVREVIVNASSLSLYHRAPVLDALSIDGLTANLVRIEEQRFNFSDILKRIEARPKTDDAPLRFSLNNIRVTDSVIRFDDRPLGSAHVVSDIKLGIPFLSNLPAHVEIDVQPALSARLDGAPIELKGETQPFAETLESAIDLKLDGLNVPKYLAYSPVRLNFAVPRGALSTDLRVAFRRAAPAKGDRPAVAARTIISGRFEVTDFALAAPATQPKPLLTWKSLAVVLEEVDPFATRAVIGDVALVAPTVEVSRDATGALNWIQFLQQPTLSAPAAPAVTTTPTPAKTPLAMTLRHASVREGTVNLADDSAGMFRLQAVNLQADVANLTTTAPERGKVQLKFDVAEGGGTTSLDGEVGLAPLGGQLALAMRNTRLRAPARYLANVINGTLDGSSDVDGVLEFAAAQPAVTVLLRDINVRGKAISLRGPKGSGADFDLAGLTIDGATIDLTGRRITFDKLSLDAPRTTLRRLPDGGINWQQVLRAKPVTAAGSATLATTDSSTPPWKVMLKEASITRGDVRLEDQAVDPNVKVRTSNITGTVRNVASDGSERAELALRTTFGSGGTLSVQGGARWNPIVSDLRVDARNLDVSAVRPYLATRLNAVLARAEASARGNVTISQKAEADPLYITYKGSARLGNLHLLDARGENDLLKWQVLDLDQIDLKLGDQVPKVTVGKLALSDFYARVIVSEQGRLNLVDIVRRDADSAEAETAAAPSGNAPSAMAIPKREADVPVDRDMAGNTPEASTAKAAKLSAKDTSAAVDPAAPRPILRFGHMEFTRGNVNFTDNFIKPNYTANMTGLAGSATTLASDSAEPATLTLAGKIDDEAPVDISGRLNPLAPTLFLDIEGRTKGVDLPRLTPYAVKYAGYPIIKGKLSMEVRYKVEGGKLAANNHLFLDQLTFGDKVESPTATKLPVLLAVSLLKNSKGEIDINLPISGTLDDPKFSVGGIIIQVIVNLLTKVVTAPFTLLAAAFGGGEELGYIEFAPGTATLKDDQVKRLDTLAKALADRPGLKLDIIGRVEPAADTDGVRRAKYDAKLKAAKVKGLVRRGGDAVDPSTVSVSPEERAALIASVYSDADIEGKPRNFIGIAKSIPAPEMEALILSSLTVTPEDLRALANQRATTVRNHLETQGKISRERLFLVEPRLTAEGIQDKGPTTRVDFSLK